MHDQEWSKNDGPAESGSKGISPSLIAAIVAAALAVTFVLQNRTDATVKGLFWTINTSMWVVIIAVDDPRGVPGLAGAQVDAPPRRVTGIASSDGVTVHLHDLAGESAPDHPLVFVAHATGFHARAYLPVATALAPPFHVVGPDFRGHGDTPPAPGPVNWTGYGDDADAVSGHLVDQPGGEHGLVGFGHSKGGAALLMAAARHPERFRCLVLFEPIVFPPVEDADPAVPRPESPLPAGARRRRATFPSIDAAIENYSSKPPMATFAPAALDAYVRFGFRPNPDGGGIRLKCEPEHEAQTFENGGAHGTWALLPDIAVPTLVIAGTVDEFQPSGRARPIADALPNGRYLELPELDHFGPFTHPTLMAELIVSAVDEMAPGAMAGEDDTPVVP